MKIIFIVNINLGHFLSLYYNVRHQPRIWGGVETIFINTDGGGKDNFAFIHDLLLVFKIHFYGFLRQITINLQVNI